MKRRPSSFLRRMSGRTHLVYSGLTLLWAGAGPGERVEETAHAVTEVRFAPDLRARDRSYICNAANGATAPARYAIQGRASAFVEEIRGDYTNVVGLPVPLLAAMLREKGQWPPAGWTIDHPETSSRLSVSPHTAEPVLEGSRPFILPCAPIVI